MHRNRSNMNLISIENIYVNYGAKNVLHGVDLSIDEGEIVTIVGPNGSGKTSLLRAIIGATSLQKGKITLKDNLKMGYVPQRLNFDSSLPMTVERFMHLSNNINKKECFNALEKAGAPNIFKSQISQLSGGQFQRVLLARAIIDKPDILLLDEATQGLDQPGSALFYKQIEEVRRETNCAVLMISHDLHVVMSTSDRVICLNGHVCCSGTPANVASDPEYKAMFGAGTEGTLALYQHQHDHDHDHRDKELEHNV